ncbi:hypothetical protein VH571_15135 [Frondihabitans sp. 4ASC-45]|uniref:hypothetical protein n=1 Tax=Frondihabitans sp. 4ASC-45 TaxID=3111636 RepID=UPI003C272732
MSDLDPEKRGADELRLPTVVENDSAEIEGALHAHLAGEFPQPERVPVPVAATLRTIEHVLPMRSRSHM